MAAGQVLLGLWALLCLTSAAEVGTSLNDLSLRAWRLEDGLPAETVSTLLQTRDGYLWLGTDEGLIRFDGVRFEIFHNRNTPAFTLNRVSHLAESSDGCVWIATSGGGIVCKDGPNFRRYGAADGLSNEQVRVLALGRNDRLWAGTDGGGLFLFEGDRFRAIPSPNPAVRFIVGVAEAPDGSAVIATPRAGLWRWDGTAWTRIVPENAPGPTLWTVLHQGRGGRIWAGSQQGLWKYEDGRLTPVEWPGTAPGSIQGILESESGELFIGTQRDLHRLANGVAERTQLGAGFSTRGTSILLKDSEGSVWAATDGLGLAQLKRTKFFTLGTPEGLTHDEVTSTTEALDGSVWLTTANGLNQVTTNGVRKFTKAEGLTDDFLFSSYQGPDGTLWFGTRTAGGMRYRDGRFEAVTFYGRRQSLAIWCIHGDAQGTVWMGSTRGLHTIRPDGSVDTLTGAEGLSNDDVRSIAASPDGLLWVGTSYGLNLLRNGQVVTNWANADGHPLEIISTLHAERDGTVWVGTLDRGLFRYREGRFSHFSAVEGLPDASVYQILDDGRDRLWFTCGRGVYSVAKADLNAVADRLSPQIQPNLYNRADGLRTLELTASVQPAGMRTRDGRLWFASNRGVSILDPLRLPRNTVAPRPRIDRVVLSAADTNLAVRVRAPSATEWQEPSPERLERSPGGRRTLTRLEVREPDGTLELPPGIDFLEFQFTAPTFIAAKDLNFRCQLEGFDRGWIEMGQRRAAYYTRVPHGRYRFRVAAVNHDGMTSISDATLEVILRPHWWQTRWVAFSLVATCLLGAIGGHRWRINALERRRIAQETFARQLIASQESERRRIASDLHDSLEQELLVIKNRADLALLDATDPTSAQQQLTEISQLAMHAVEDVRQITHDLRPKLLDRLGLTRALRTLLDRIADGSSLAVDSDIDPIDGLLQPADEINLYRIVQESLNNVLKHAQARTVRIRLTQSAGRVELEVSDDGKGFEPARIQDDEAFGLRGLEERARILGGELTIRSQPGHGTTVLARFPLPNLSRP